MGLLYRLTQLWWNLTAGPLPEPCRQEIDRVLTPAQRELYLTFQAADQWHAYRVFQALKEAGDTHPDLLTAALLHDIGKTRVRLTVWDRMVVVAASRLMPAKTASWGRGEPRAWRRAFVVRHCHPQWGAEMASEAGTADLAIRLIARHQTPVSGRQLSLEDQLLLRLQQADDLN